MPSLAGLATAVEERLLVPAYGSRWRRAPIAAHRGLSLPMQLTGSLRRHGAGGGESVRVAAVGREKLVEPIVERLLGGAPLAGAEPRRGLWNPASLARLDTDLVVAEVHRWMAPRFRRAGWVIVPSAVRWCGALSQVPGPTPCHSLREDLRKLSKQGFTLTDATSSGDWDLFATRMVVPQARARFGDHAWIPSPRLLRRFERSAALHFVCQGGRVVAGFCSVACGDTLWLPISGVLDGDPVLFRRGAGLAILALGIEWARARGFRVLDAGRTSPFENDGVHRLKRKWGLRPAVDPLAHVAAVRAGSAAARAAFAREPVLVETGEGLAAYRGDGA
jgi:hypothetical protein